jgi:hypothetical protein
MKDHESILNSTATDSFLIVYVPFVTIAQLYILRGAEYMGK